MVHSEQIKELGQLLINASFAGKEGRVKELISKAREQDVIDKIINYKQEEHHNDYTPIHAAAASGNLEILQLLIHEGADVQIAMSEGTVLHSAAVSGSLELVKYLVIDQGLKPDAKRTKDGNTPLHTAAFFGHLDIVKYFVEECKVPPNIEGYAQDAKDEHGLKCRRTPINSATFRMQSMVNEEDIQKYEKIQKYLLAKTKELLEKESQNIDEYNSYVEGLIKGLEKNIADGKLTKVDVYAKTELIITTLQHLYNYIEDSDKKEEICYEIFKHNIMLCEEEYFNYKTKNSQDLGKIRNGNFVQTALSVTEYSIISCLIERPADVRKMREMFEEKIENIFKSLSDENQTKLLTKIQNSGYIFASRERFSQLKELENKKKTHVERLADSRSNIKITEESSLVIRVDKQYHEKILHFRDYLQRKLENKFHEDRVIISGAVQRKKDNVDFGIESGSFMSTLALNSRKVHVIGSAIEKGICYLRDWHFESVSKRSKRFSNCHISVMTKKAVDKVTYRLQNQLAYLSEESIEMLADCLYNQVDITTHSLMQSTQDSMKALLRRTGIFTSEDIKPSDALYNMMIDIPITIGQELRFDNRAVRSGMVIAEKKWLVGEMMQCRVLEYGGDLYGKSRDLKAVFLSIYHSVKNISVEDYKSKYDYCYGEFSAVQGMKIIGNAQDVAKCIMM